jgi:hypothetical protein
MTALEKFQRLEASGLWRAAPDEQRRDTVVSLGKATLTISDSRSGAILSHWSLPAVVRLNPGQTPALFAPTDPQGDEGETLELDDPLMIDALTTIRRALSPKRIGRRVRLAMAGAALAAVALVGLVWVPRALTDHAASITPQAARAQLGRQIVEALATTTPPVRGCAAPAGRAALTSLRLRLMGSNHRLLVLDGAPDLTVTYVPGRLILVGRAFLEGLDSAETLAGHVLAAELALEGDDPMRALLRHAGVVATTRFLTTGDLPRDSLASFGALTLARPAPPIDPAALSARMAERNVPIGPYLATLTDEGLTEAMTQAQLPTARALQPLVSDGEWLTLQNICS